MKYLLTYKLYEKSSLTYLGVPEEVMQDIQKQFALSDDAQWKQLRFKKDLRTELRKEDNLFVIISEDKKQITVVFLVEGILYVDNYQYYQADDMGDEYWDKEPRKETNVTEVNKLITRGSDIYKLISGDWTPQIRAKRKIRKKTEEFKDFTINFKKDFAENFTRIIKKLYKKNAYLIQKIVMQKLMTQNKNIDPELAKEVLLGFQDDAKRAEFFRKRGEEKDPFKLQLQFIRDNSLTIFNEYLISFEDDMSRKYGEFTNIQKLSEKFTRDKVMTAFMYYLWSGSLMNL